MTNVDWKFVNNNVSIDDIKNIESTLDIKLPKDYIECAMANNAGYPDKFNFDMEKEKGKVFEYLLSISKDDDENMVDVYLRCKNSLPDRVIPFAKDPFGNFICFKYTDLDKCEIVFYNHEDQGIYFISNSFSEFINKLY